jgi:pimeloyl-ACP methyl ester carboxylesterase
MLLMLIAVEHAHGQSLTPAACHFGREVQAWQGQVNCYRMTVPENRQDPTTADLDLAVYEIKARNDTDAAPVVYLAGGPGVSGSYYVNLLLRHPLRADRSIMILEQRGVGASGELCPSVRRNYYRRVASRRDNNTRHRQFIGLLLNCFDAVQSDGRDIDGYTTEENAADVADLRTALGLSRMDLWAISYGTVLAQAYMRSEPDHIGAVVFDATVPIDYALETGLTRNFRRVLDQRWTQCIADGECDEGDQSFTTRLEEIIPEYNRRPLRLLGFSPEPSIVVNFVYVTGVDAAGIVFSLLYGQAPPEAIDRVLGFLERKSSSFLRAHYQRLAIPGFSFGMHYAVNCRGAEIGGEELAELRAEDPIFFDAMQVGFQYELCTNSDLGPVAITANEAVNYSGPVLVLSGEFDPITPLSVAEPFRERFPNAGFLEISGGGHGPSRSLPCAQAMVRNYFANPQAPVADICSH